MKERFVEKECKHHGLTTFILENRGAYRCKKCRSNCVTLRRKKVKAMLVQHFGGACKCCGYDRYAGSLDFHHRDPTQKDFGISDKGLTMSYAKMLVEAEKCVLVCRNCHQEIHAGITECPA